MLQLTKLSIWPRAGALLAAALASAHTTLAADKVNFQDHVLPIFRAHCGNCHNQNKAKGDVDLLSYGAVMKGGSSGAIVQAGASDSSRLYKVTAHLDEPKMPPSGQKIPDKDLAVLKQWIEEGILEAAGGQAKKSNKPKMELSLSAASVGKPVGPAAMPKGDWLLEPYVRTARASMPHSMAASPWAPLLAVAAQKQVLLIHAETLELIGVLPFPEGMPYVVRFSRNGSLLLAGGGRAGKSGKVVVWNAETGERVADVGDEPYAVLAADISADQSLIALGGSGKLVKVFSTKTGELVHSMKKHTDWVLALSFSPDGVLLGSADRNGGLVVWESGSGREFYSLLGHTAAVNALAWRDDSNIIASASEDTTIRMWEMNNGTQVKSWGGHGGGVLDLASGHDGGWISSGRDNVVKTWKPDGNLLRQFEGFSDLSVRAAVSHDNKRAFGADLLGNIRAWSMENGNRLAEFTTNPPTIAERLDSLTKLFAVKKTARAAVLAANTAAQASLVNVQKAIETAAKTAAAAAAAEKANVAAIADLKSKTDKSTADVAALTGSVKAKSTAAAVAAANAAAAKAAFDAGANHEKTVQQLFANHQAAVVSTADLDAKSKTAMGMIGGDGAVKTAVGRTAVVKQSLDAALEQLKKSAAESAQMHKELADASSRFGKAAEQQATELAAMKQVLTENEKRRVETEAQWKAAVASAPKLADAQKTTAAALVEQQKLLKPATDGAAAATANLVAADAELADLPHRIAKLNRALAFAKNYKLRASLESTQAAAEKLAESSADAKRAVEKAQLAFDESMKAIEPMSARAKAASAAVVALKPGLDAAAKEVAELQTMLAVKKMQKTQSSELALKLKMAAPKSPNDANAKDAAIRAEALAKSIVDDSATLEKISTARTAAHAALAAQFDAAEKVAAKLHAEVVAATAKRAKLGETLAALKIKATADAAAAAEANKALLAAKAAHDEAKTQLAKMSAN